MGFSIYTNFTSQFYFKSHLSVEEIMKLLQDQDMFKTVIECPDSDDESEDQSESESESSESEDQSEDSKNEVTSVLPLQKSYYISLHDYCEEGYKGRKIKMVPSISFQDLFTICTTLQLDHTQTNIYQRIKTTMST